MKKLLIGIFVVFGIVFVLFLAAGGYIYFRYGKTIAQSSKMPEIFNSPTVLMGEGAFQKQGALDQPKLGLITDIEVGGLARSTDTQAEFALVGLKGAVFLDKDRQVVSSVTIGHRTSHVDMIDVEQDGQVEFMDRGAWSENPAIYESDGTLRWRYSGGLTGINDMSAGNFDADKHLEFVVGFNGGGGVHLVDENGEQLWKKRDGNVWQVEARDTNGDGIAEIIHSNAAGQITVRDVQGHVLKQTRPHRYFSDFAMLAPSNQYMISPESDRIWLYDFDGNVVKDFDAPHAGTLGSPCGTMVQFDKEGSKHYAFGVSYRNWKKCNVYIYDSEGNLEFHELLEGRCAAATAVPLSDGREAFWIGNESKVLEFRR